MPPWSEVESALLKLALAGGGAAFLVALLVRLCGEGMTPAAAAMAVVAGVVLSNHYRDATAYLSESGPLHVMLGLGLEGGAGEDGPSPEGPSFWLPWLAASALLIDLLARLRPDDHGVNWAVRALLAAFAGRLLVAHALRMMAPWLPWVLALAILAQWAALWWLSERWKNGGALLAVSPALAAGGVVLLHAHSGKMADLGLMMGCAVAGVALAGLIFGGDWGSVSGAAAVWLPGLMAAGWWETSAGGAVPAAAFLVAGLSPLALVPLVPRADGLKGWRGVAWAASLGLLGACVAVGIAARAAPLRFDEPGWH